jgi:hypothetical protein
MIQVWRKSLLLWKYNVRIQILELFFLWGRKVLHIVYGQFTEFSSTVLWTTLQHDNVGCFANMQIFEKKKLRPIDKMGKLLQDVEYLSGYAPKTLNANVWATTFLLTCLFGFIIGERKQQILITYSKTLCNRKSKVLSFKNALNLTNNNSLLRA